MGRTECNVLNDILGLKFRVLDQGFIRVVDYMGDDSSIVQAARISYGEGTKTPSDDRTLIRYLMRHRHSTPLEMCELKLHIRAPMDTWRQWIRHRTASVNEYSTRYSEAIDDKQKTLDYQWRKQSPTNKQGSAEFLNTEGLGFDLSKDEDLLHQHAEEVYKKRLHAGVAREQARKDLPLSTYTEAYWKIDLHNLLHFLALRMDSHAQLEIREYATAIGEQIVAVWVPHVWRAFQDYQLCARTFSGMEMAVLRDILRHPGYNTIVQEMLGESVGLGRREKEEFLQKLRG